VEPGKRHRSRNSSESDDGKSLLIELERRVLFQPLQWLSGALTYANGPHSLAFEGMGNLGQTAFRTAATPVQNNGSMYAVIYTYTKGPGSSSLLQFTDVPTNLKIGIAKGAGTGGGALLVSHGLQARLLARRTRGIYHEHGERRRSSCQPDVRTGSAGWSATLTAHLSIRRLLLSRRPFFVRASNYTPGYGFGPTGMNQNQPRAVAEIGFIFGNNIIAKKP